MLQRPVRVEQQRDIGAAPERVWSLVGSSAAWLPLPGWFAFDVAGALLTARRPAPVTKRPRLSRAPLCLIVDSGRPAR